MSRSVIKNGKKPAFLFLCFFVFQSYIYAQTPYFKSITISRDNAGLGINDMFIDRSRFLWLATNEGLYKFNGRTASVFLLNVKGAGQEVTAVIQDSRENIWVGFKSGEIAMLQDSVLIPVKSHGDLSASAITSIMEDKQGRIWMTTAGDGIFYMEGANKYHLNADDGLADNYTYSMEEDQQGRMWVGTDQGVSICSLSGTTVKIININKGMPDEIVRVIRKDEQGNMWVGMQEKGICKINSSTLQITVPTWSENWNYGQVNDILLNHYDIWIATQEQGLISLSATNEKDISNYTSYGNIKFSEVDNLLIDAENNLWLSNKTGLIQSHGKWLMFINKINDEKISFVHALGFDAANNLFFTPDQGLRIISTENKITNIKKYQITNPSSNVDIVSIVEDECGFLWIGTMGDGLYRFNPNTESKQKIEMKVFDYSSILSMVIDEKVLWMATLGGVVRCELPTDCNTEKIKINAIKLDSVPQIGNYYIYTIFIDSKKRIWFGTDNKGVTVYDHGKYFNYNTDNGLPGNTVYAITEGSHGNIWISIAGSGICRYDGKTFKQFAATEGLRELTVTSIKEIGPERIMMVHRRGIDIIHTVTGKVDYYGLENNLSILNPDLNAIAEDNLGRVWIGTEQGIVIFDPLRNIDPAGPKIILQRVSLFEYKKNYIKQNEFAHNENYLSFDFTGLWYTDPGRVKYQYMMEGYNKEWINTTDNRIIYPNLQPGSYVFKVRTTNSRNFNFSDEAQYSFVIQKPFWAMTWFRIIILLIVLLGAGLYIRDHDKRIKRIEALKKESIEYRFETLKSQVNPHFLFNSFNTLIGIIEKDKNIAVEYVEKLSDYFRNMIQHRDAETILLKTEIEMVSTYYYLQKKRFGNDLLLEVKLTKEVLEKCKVPPLSLQLLIENAIKHNTVSRETPLKVEIFQSGSDNIVVKNNINKKITKESSTGFGLMNIINRYKILTQREVLIQSNETSFSVTVPLIS